MPLFGSPSPSAPLQPAQPGEGQYVEVDHETLVVASAPYSPQAEEYRRLRNSIQALNPDGAARTILVTSAVDGEGKTVSTLNLGLAMAELPQVRVLVGDVNLLDPALEDRLGLPRRQGFMEVLAGELSVDQAIRSTTVPRFDVLGLGSTPEAPAINVDRVRAVFHALKRSYDYVLLDAPSVLSANHASVLGSLADGILLVVRLGSTPREVVEQAYTMLENLGGNVLGTCATGVQSG